MSSTSNEWLFLNLPSYMLHASLVTYLLIKTAQTEKSLLRTVLLHRLLLWRLRRVRKILDYWLLCCMCRCTFGSEHDWRISPCVVPGPWQYPVAVCTVFQSCFLHKAQQQLLADTSAQYLVFEFKIQCKEAYGGVMGRWFYVVGSCIYVQGR